VTAKTQIITSLLVEIINQPIKIYIKKGTLGGITLLGFDERQ
jgi:hypothetical protein